MFRILGTFLATAGLLTSVACTGLQNPVSPVKNGGTATISVKFSTPKAGAPALAQAPATDFTTGIVSLSKGALNQTAPITIANGRASASIPGLEAGLWTITLNFYNATGTLTYTGTSTVTIQNGVTTSASITIDPVSGGITFDFGLPIDGNDFVGNYLSTYDGNHGSFYWNNNTLMVFNGNDTTTGVPVAPDRVNTPGWNGYAILSADHNTITWYLNDGSLVHGTGAAWIRE